MRKEIDRFGDLIAGGSGNPYSGKKLFASNCGKCHVLFTEGGQIGPDLTAYKRDDLKTMLLNVVNPSAEIREGFENYLIMTGDGRALNGFVTEQDANVVVLRGIDGQSLTIAREDIERMSTVPRSLMPEGLLKPLSLQEVRDLFAYLRSTLPLP
jgi:putative heme-binding domain-containing protein